MADSKVTALTADGAPAATDVTYNVEDPAGTPVSKKVTWTNVAAGAAFTAAYVPKSSTAWAIKDYDEVTVAGGDITMNQTAITGLTGFDMTLTAASGDRVLYGISARLESVAVIEGFDVFTMVAGSRVNPFGAGLSASLGSTAGVGGWLTPGTAQLLLAGEVPRTLVGGDISSGTVTLRLHYAGAAVTARKIFANSNMPAKVWATVLTPVT